jgi:hypothetical protein
LLSAGGYVGSAPLLSAGHAGAADSIYLRGTGEDRYVVGLDHWSVGATESAPVKLAPGEPHTLVVEMGSLFSGEEVPKDRVRLWLDGQLAMDAKIPLFPVKTNEVIFGRNPLGMSTSNAAFRGEIISVRPQQPAGEVR